MDALIVVAHPDPASLTHALAHALRRTWEASGCAVEFRDLHAEGFDPVLSVEEARGEPTTDPLARAHVEALKGADLLGVVHPNYWGAPPAMMKGWIDRAFAPDAAYGSAKGEQGPEGLLRVRAAVVLNTGNTPADREEGHFGDPLDRIWRACVLGFCGVERVERRLFQVVSDSTPEERAAWIAEAEALAARAHGLA